MMTSTDEEMPDVDSQSTDESRIQSSSQPGSPLAAEVPTTEVEISETISIVADEKASGKIKVRKLRPKKGTPDPEVVNPRGYQREMLEHSLKRNVIVAVSDRALLIRMSSANMVRWTQEAERPKCMLFY